MAGYLVAISIGPVQGFVAAARRTRDFWMGSTIVSECAKAIAKRVSTEFGLEALIFPAPIEAANLDPINFDAQRSEIRSEFDVTNVVLFTAVVDDDPKTLPALAQTLKDAAQGRWNTIATQAAGHCVPDLLPDWEDQLKDNPIEFYAAWVPLGAHTYAEARQTVMRLLAGRKACRNFEPWTGKPGVPKSSLDGARETVLRPTAQRRAALRVKPKEELDLIGIVKRVNWGHDAVRYPSVSRVAIDPWVRGVIEASKHDPRVGERFQDIRDTCKNLRLRHRKEKNPDDIEDDMRKFPWLRSFEYEGTPLYASRHGELVEELLEQWDVDPTNADWDNAKQSAKNEIAPLGEHLRALGALDVFSEPWSYLAVLAADGDGMGRVLSEIAQTGHDPKASHKEFSNNQSQFASAARELINKQHSGVCVFASADDVLAFVAVDQCLGLARSLYDTFDRQVGECARRLGVATPPTLSIGLAIGHFMEPLEDLLDYAREAERRAKNPSVEDQRGRQEPRNGLAVAVHSRGGAPFIVRDNWGRDAGDGLHGLDERLKEWARLHHNRELPAKAAYELRDLSRRHHPDTHEAAIRLDACRVLARKRGSGGGAADTSHIEQLVKQVRTPADLRRVADELLVGQWIGRAKDQSAGKRSEDAESGSVA